MSEPEEFIEGTRFPVQCQHCGSRRRLLMDTLYIACECYSGRWIHCPELKQQPDSSGVLALEEVDDGGRR